MKKHVPYIGIYLIILGTLTLAATRLKALMGSNALLTVGLFLIVAGIIAHVRAIKRESSY